MASFKSLNHIYFSGRIILLEHFYVYIDIYCKNIGLDTWFSYMLVVSTFEVRTRTLDLLAQLLSMWATIIYIYISIVFPSSCTHLELT